jgi:hypothetical protein
MAWLRVIGLQNTMYIRKLSTLNMNISFRTLQSKADKSALIDSGATDNFINEETWKRLGIRRKELARPVMVHNVNGTENKQGKITHYCWLRIIKGEKHMLQQFYITALGKDRIILGYPFLYDFNPKINWKWGRSKENQYNSKVVTTCTLPKESSSCNEKQLNK